MKYMQTNIFKDRPSSMIPVISLEEFPTLTDTERIKLIAELDRTEADMIAGNFEVYSPEWLDKKFRVAMVRA